MEHTLLYSCEKASSLASLDKRTGSKKKWEVGQIIDDKYDIQEILAQNEDEVIHKVHHCQWNIHLAVRSQLKKENQVRFFHEAERWVALEKHPNIIGAYYVQNIGGIPRLFVEYANAQTLAEFIAHEYDIETILDIGIQICWGMEHAHSKGLLHGDLRPDNVFITEKCEIKIADFKSRTDMVTDYSPYMPPEQFEEDVPMQPSIDIYAFGTILYELCLKKLPFKVGEKRKLRGDETIQAYTNMALTQQPQHPSKANPAIPDRLSAITMQCLSIEPTERPRHFDEIEEDLRDIYTQLTGFRYPRRAPDASALMAADMNNRAISLLDLGQEEEAEEYLEQAVAADPRCAGAVLNSHLLKLRHGKSSLASFLFGTEPLLRLEREVVSFYRSKICLEYGGFLDEALQEVLLALEEFPSNKELVRLKGLLLRRLGRYQEAIEIFKGLVETDHPSIKDLYSLGVCYLSVNKSKSARAIWDQALDLYPGDSFLQIGLGVSIALRGQVEEAHIHFSKLVEQDPDNFWARLHLAEITAACGKYIKTYGRATPDVERACQLYNQLLQQAPYFPRVLYGYELCHKQLPQNLTVSESSKSTKWGYARSLKGHNEGVHCMGVSPDGRLVIVGGGDDNLHIWEIATGKCKSVLQAHSEGTSQVCVSHDGHFAVSIGRESVVRVWDLIAGECVSRLDGHVRDVTCVALTRTGYLITGSLDKTLRVWDLGALECKKILKGHTDKINCLAVTPDGAHAISGSEDKLVGIWEVEGGKCLGLMRGHIEGVTCLAVSPDGKFAVSGGWDQKLHVWDIAIKKCIAILEGHSGTLNCICITPDSKYIISGSEDKTVRIWDIRSGECIHILRGHTVDVTCLCVAPKSRFIVSGSWDHSLRIWSLDDGKCLAVLEAHTDLVNTLAITPDEMYIISGGDDTTLRVWSDLSTQVCPSFEEPNLAYLLQRPPSHDGNMEGQRRVEKLFAQAEVQLQEGKIADSIQLYREIQKVKNFERNTRVLQAIHRTAMKHKLKRSKPQESWHQRVFSSYSTGGVSAIATSPDGNLLITGTADSNISIWDLEEGNLLYTLRGHKGPISCISVSPNGRYIISGSRDQTLRLWEVETGRCIYDLKGHNHWVEYACFTPDGRRIISGSRDATIKIWEIKTGHRLYSLTNHTDLISALEITHDNSYMVSASHDRTIRIWELESGTCLHVLEGHSDHIKRVVCIPGSDQILSGGWDGLLHLWNVKTGDCVRTYQQHENWINDICITPNRKKVLSSSLDTKIRVWDTDTAENVWVLEGHKQDVNHIAVTPDSRFCISTSSDGSLKIWDLEGGECCDTLIGHKEAIVAMQVIHEGRHIVTASKDGNLILWEIDWNWELPD